VTGGKQAVTRQHSFERIPPPCHTETGSVLNAMQMYYLLTVKKQLKVATSVTYHGLNGKLTMFTISKICSRSLPKFNQLICGPLSPIAQIS